MPDALYEPVPGSPGSFLATELTRGPWSPDAQHGGPPSALLAMAVEAHDDDAAPRCSDSAAAPMFVARVTVELLRPVPLGRLDVKTRAERPGRKVQLVSASLLHDGREVARATALRTRQADVPVPEGAKPRPPSPPPPGEGVTTSTPWHHPGGAIAYHSHAVEHRFVAGGFDRPGPAIDWIRLRVPLVAGRATPPVSRVAAAADFGNGVSWVLSRVDGWQFINPDLTVYLHAYPAGEWVSLDAVTWPGDHGVGLAESLLRDERGPIGRSLQSLLVEKPR